MLCLLYVVCLYEDPESGVLDTLRINVFRKKTQKRQTFHVVGIDHVKRYQRIEQETRAIRDKCGSDKVFWQRRERKKKGKKLGIFYWHSQVCGVHWFEKYTGRVAKAIAAKNGAWYTHHSLRRTGATMMAESGATKVQLKSYGGWTSDATAEGYVEDSALNCHLMACTLENGRERLKRSLCSMQSDEFEPKSPSHTPTPSGLKRVYNYKGKTVSNVSDSACDLNLSVSEYSLNGNCVGSNERAYTSECSLKRIRLMFDCAVFNNCVFNMR